jgi:hypothetical protein
VNFGDGIGWIVALVALVIAAGAIAFAAVTTRSRGRAPGIEVLPPAEPAVRPAGLAGTLRQYQQAGRWPELLRLLDQTLPEWVVSASLIETAREISKLEEALARARVAGVTEEVSGRLATQAASVTDDLWALADRLVASDRTGSRAVRESLEAQDAALLRLQGAIREAREDLATLSLSSLVGGADLRRSETRFRALAATARELHEWERERVPW